MKKIFSLIIAVGMMFAIAGQASAFDSGNLVMVAYNAENNEYAMDLGPVTSLTSGVIELSAHDIDAATNFSELSWSEIRLGFFVVDGYDLYFSSPSDSLAQEDLNFTAFNSFKNAGDTANSHYTTNPFVGSSSNNDSFSSRFEQSGKAEGSYAGLLTEAGLGTVALTDLGIEGNTLDLYLYHVGPDYSGTTPVLALLEGETTPYAAEIQMSAVPVPSSVFLIGSGIICLLGIRRKRNA